MATKDDRIRMVKLSIRLYQALITMTLSSVGAPLASTMKAPVMVVSPPGYKPSIGIGAKQETR